MCAQSTKAEHAPNGRDRPLELSEYSEAGPRTIDNLPVPVGAFVFARFGIVYGWILHSAVDRSVFKISSIRVLVSYFLSWLLGLVTAFTPMMFFVALGFHEFADTPDGNGVIVLATVPQRS